MVSRSPDAYLNCSLSGPAASPAVWKSHSPEPPGHVQTEPVSRTPCLWPNSASLLGGPVGMVTEAPHLLQGVVGGIVKGVGGGSPGLEGKHLLLLLVQQRLHVLNHGRVLNVVGLQEDLDSLDAGEGHSDIDGGARLGRAAPEVQLGRTRTRTITAGWGGASLGAGAGARTSHVTGKMFPGAEDKGSPWAQDKDQYGERNGPGSRVGWGDLETAREGEVLEQGSPNLCSDVQMHRDSGSGVGARLTPS